MSLTARITGRAPQATIASGAVRSQVRVANPAADLQPLFPNTVVSSPLVAARLSAQAALMPSGGTIDGLITHLAAQTLGGQRAVYLASDGLRYASASDLATVDSVVGITTHASATGGATIVRREGECTESSWAWIPSEPIYLGLDGLLTQTPPVSGAVVVLGFAATPQTIFIRIEQPTYLA